MRTRKWIAFFLSLTMLFSLCACGDDSKKEETKTSKTTITTKPDDKNQPNTDDKFDDNKHHLLPTQSTNTITSMTHPAELPIPQEGLANIALLCLGDENEINDVTILSIDRREKNNPRVKLSSLARDTLVYVEGYNSKNSMTKLAHAFQYGYNKAKAVDKEKKYTQADYKREGAKVAIKTINYNFQMNITEYMYVNFVEFMDIIDYVGGVTINVQQRELNELNKHVLAMEKECGRNLNTVKEAGEQTLDGGQALAYSRIRKIDSDLMRTNRQRDVIKQVLAKIQATPIDEMRTFTNDLLNVCHTNVELDYWWERNVWLATNKPEIFAYTLPDTKISNWIWEGNHPNYNWVWIYDLDYASALLIDFIYDKDTAKAMTKPTMPNESKVTKPTAN